MRFAPRLQRAAVLRIWTSTLRERTPRPLREVFINFVEDHLKQQGVDLRERLVINCPKGFEFDDESLRMRVADGCARHSVPALRCSAPVGRRGQGGTLSAIPSSRSASGRRRPSLSKLANSGLGRWSER